MPWRRLPPGSASPAPPPPGTWQLRLHGGEAARAASVPYHLDRSGGLLSSAPSQTMPSAGAPRRARRRAPEPHRIPSEHDPGGEPVTPGRPWLGITRPVLADRGRHTSAGGWRQAARAMPGNAAGAGPAMRARPGADRPQRPHRYLRARPGPGARVIGEPPVNQPADRAFEAGAGDSGRAIAGAPDGGGRMRSKAGLCAAIREHRRAALVVNTRSRRGRRHLPGGAGRSADRRLRPAGNLPGRPGQAAWTPASPPPWTCSPTC